MKRSEPAKLWLPDQEPREVQVFLKEHSQWRAGPELPSDLFVDERVYIPVDDPEWGTVLIKRDSLMAMTVALDQTPPVPRVDESPGETPGIYRVSVFLTDGTMLEGELTAVQHGQVMRRLQDYMNLEEKSFILRDGAEAHIVNKAWTVAVRDSEETLNT
ncbi:MAG: hypothetical protein ABFS14_01170 [Gemmatimonadota bacterium]